MAYFLSGAPTKVPLLETGLSRLSKYRVEPQSAKVPRMSLIATDLSFIHRLRCSLTIRLCLVIVTCWQLSLGASFADAQTAKERSEPLVGVSKMMVAIADPDNDARKAGLTKERLRTIVELKLRLAGIRVLSIEDARKDPDSTPVLRLDIDVVNLEKEKLIVFFVELQLREFIASSRNSAIIPAVLWEAGGLAAADDLQMPKYAEEYASDLTEDFVNTYLRANPKK